MKKIFIVAIVAMLCCVMLIPVSAETNTYRDFNFNEYIEIDGLSSTYPANFIYDNSLYIYYCDAVKIYDGKIWFEFHSRGNHKNDEIEQIDDSVLVYQNYKDTWWDKGWIYGLRTIKIDTQDFDDSDYQFLNNIGQFMCDGSACPATDMNIDGICDDCGMMLRLVMPSTYPTLPEVNGNNLHSVVLSRDDGFFYMVLKSDTPYSVTGDVSDTYLITVANEQKVTYVTYKCTDGKNWVQNNSGEAYSLSVGDNTATLLDSTFDWYKDGTIFFQVPLWKVMDNLTQGEMKVLTPTVVAILATLTIVGVGCLASLVLLKIFGKRSLIYRN